MYFPAEHLLDKLQISAQELSEFEQKGIVEGIPKAGRVFYSSRDMYRLGELRLYESAAGVHVSMGNGVDSLNSCGNLYDVQGDRSMSNSNGIDAIHVRQMLAFAENLYLQARRHHENHNYVVAHALYGHALVAAQRIDTPDNPDNGNGLVARIQKEQQAVFEILRSNLIARKKAPFEKVGKVGQ
jgi:hypothetical protein